MTKQEFDTLSEEAGFGLGCAPEMWPEVELVYMAGDDGRGHGIPGFPNYSKRAMVDLYWNHTGTFETLVRWAKSYAAVLDELSSTRAKLRKVAVHFKDLVEVFCE